MAAAVHKLRTCICWWRKAPTPENPRQIEADRGTEGHGRGPESPIPSLVYTEASRHSDAHGTENDDDEEEEGGPLISRFIDCFVEVKFAQAEVGRSQTPLRLEWTEMGQYKAVKREAWKILADHFKAQSQPVPRRRRLGDSVRLCRRTENGSSVILEQRNIGKAFPWRRFMPAIGAAYGSGNGSKDLFFEVYLTYDKSVLEYPGDTIAEKTWEAIHKNMKYGLDDKPFLPKSKLNSIFSPPIVKKLVEDLEGCDKTMRTEISNFGLNILACCVYGRNMDCLVQLMGKWKNAHMPIPCRGHRFKGFTDNQSRFTVLDFATVLALLKHETSSQLETDPASGAKLPGVLEKISQKGNYFYVKSDVVLPITLEEKPIGNGGYGLVHRAKIHEDYLFRDEDNLVQDEFALKVFFNIHEQAEQALAFEQESTVLAALKLLPHKHIVVPIASWQYRRRFYMLLPLAKCDLKTHLRTSRPPRTPEFCIKLLEQLVGLAKAIEVIHSMEDSQLFKQSSGNLSRPAKPTYVPRRTGFHHDLKPANILIFEDGSWKINDFGTARISLLVSGGISDQVRSDSKSPRGDPEYRAPDEESAGGLSRPYDIWAFGCTILEVLVWIFDDGADPVDKFWRKRSETNGPNEPHAMFWCSEGDKLKLNSAVSEYLARLQLWTQGWGVFKCLVQLVRRMLEIRTKAPHPHSNEAVRPTAAEVLGILESCLRQIEADDEMYQELSLRPGRTERSVFREPAIPFYGDGPHARSASFSPSRIPSQSHHSGNLPSSTINLSPD